MARALRRTRIAAGLGLLVFALSSACSPRPSATAIVGSWTYVDNGMKWKWTFADGGSLAWAILGQTDMGGRPVAVGGSGAFSFDGAALTLKLDKFAGVPGLWRSSAAAPGFDPVTVAAVRFRGKDEMSWTFATEALGKEELKVARSE